MTKKFFVGTGKKVGGGRDDKNAKPGAGSIASPSEPESSPGRRFLVGTGKKLAPASVPVPQPVTPSPDDRLPGCICRFPFRVGHVPDCRYFDGALFVCETADLKTVQQLAELAQCSIMELEWRRHGFVGDFGCPDAIAGDVPRRRCPSCPYWNRTTDVPFQLSYENVQ